MIDGIKLEGEVLGKYKNTNPEQENTIEKLSKINIFIGSNNSGKSYFMRELFINREANKVSNPELSYILDNLSFLYYNNSNYVNFSNIFNKFSNNQIKKEWLDLIQDEKNKESNSISYLWAELYKFQETLIDLNNINELDIYIPILRSLRNISKNNTSNQDIYKDIIIQDYFSDKIKDYHHISTGQLLFKDLQAKLLGHTQERKEVRAFEDFLSNNFFNGPISIIPKLNDGVVSIHFQNSDEEKPIHQLGEGIQAIIMLTYPLFFNRGKKANVYIEEPDVHLHPGYQRVLLETLLNTTGFEDFQYYFTTHSNHFLDMTLDYKQISIYKFEKRGVDKFEITNMDNPDTTVLESIGARNSSLFLTNCTLWVEGISDRIYIRAFLKLYLKSKEGEEGFKQYKEDIHYSFFEYAGNNITHYSFLDDLVNNGTASDNTTKNINVERLCGKIMVIADDDNVTNNKSAKAERHQKLSECLGDRFIKLDAKEIENYLNEDLILNAVTKLNIGETLPNFKEKKKSFKKTDSVSKWITENIVNISAVSKYSGKTLSNKAEFAQAVVECIDEQNIQFDQLTSDAQELTEKIYRFIKENNQ